MAKEKRTLAISQYEELLLKHQELVREFARLERKGNQLVQRLREEIDRAKAEKISKKIKGL